MARIRRGLCGVLFLGVVSASGCPASDPSIEPGADASTPIDAGGEADDAGADADAGTDGPDAASSSDGGGGAPDGGVDGGAGPNDAGPLDAGGPAFVECEGSSAVHADFNAFWSTLDAQYAVFPYRLSDSTWAGIGAEACEAVNAALTDEELYDVLIGMARTLDDGHTTITASSIDRDDDGWVNVYPFYDDVEEAEFVVEENYLDDDLSWAADDWFGWGKTGSIGYLSITSLDELSPSGDEDDDVDAAAEAMGMVAADLADCTGLVVDVRANGGGWDAVSLEVARYFAGPQTVAWTKAVRNGPAHDDLGPEVETVMPAASPVAFSVPVVVLSSGGTFSAAETFLLAMRVRNDVTVLGERSSGHLSDLTDGSLPGGWEFTYSGERYTAADGEVYEAVGIPVDVEVGLDPVALSDGQDVMFEAALSLLQP